MPTSPPTSTLPQTLYIIDAYAQYFRAYHAIRSPMTSPVTKEPTNLTFGFVGMLLKLLKGTPAMGGPPDFIIVATDASGDQGTFRSQMFPQYKANRSEPPETLPAQAARCDQILSTLNIPILGADGFEADDVIATLVSTLRASHPDLRIRIISKDKDLKQLLVPNFVELFDIHTDIAFTADTLKSETGLNPNQVVDMLALMGDNADNVPGAAGIGPKTSAELIAKFSTLDNLLRSVDQVPGKKGESIKAAANILPLSRTLVALRYDVPLSFSLASADRATFHIDKLIPLCKELGFNRYQDETRELLGLPSQPSSPTQPNSPPPSSTSSPTTRPTKKTATQSSTSPLFTGPSLFDAPQPTTTYSPNTSPATSTSNNPNANYRCCQSPADLADLLLEISRAPIIAIDTETTGLSPLQSKLCGISISATPNSGWYIPIRSPDTASHLTESQVFSALAPIIQDPSIPKCGHNLKFDILVLRNAGLTLRGVAFDSMIASYLIDATRSSHSLDSLALALLNHTNISIKDLIGSGPNQRTFDTVSLPLATNYAAEDADIALRLHNIMLPQLQSMNLTHLFDNLEMPLVDVLAELEYNGILVDQTELERQRQRLANQAAKTKELIEDAAMDSLGRIFNPDSPKQLAAALFNKPDATEPGLGLKPVKRTQTGYSTDVEVLEKLSQDPLVSTPIPSLILEHRQLTKLVGTYLLALQEEINPTTKRIHASFNQTVAATGRLSSSDPNLQNIPIRTESGREIRKAFIAPTGRVLIAADYSQIELRLLAHLSKDPALIEAFLQDQDIHTAVAAQINAIAPDKVTRDQRSGAKMVNFGIVYGITPFGLARRLGCPNSTAETIINNYKTKFAGITTFLHECIAQAQTQGYVETMLKRRRPIPEIDSTNPSRRALAERTAINTVVQGSAADLIKLAMVNLHRTLGPHNPSPTIPSVKMLLQIHDELVFEADEQHAQAARELIVKHMQSAMTLSVPLKADSSIATNWYEGK